MTLWTLHITVIHAVVKITSKRLGHDNAGTHILHLFALCVRKEQISSLHLIRLDLVSCLKVDS
jgi:hypothetical protein